jgi:hypothetical protein
MTLYLHDGEDNPLVDDAELDLIGEYASGRMSQSVRAVFEQRLNEDRKHFERTALFVLATQMRPAALEGARQRFAARRRARRTGQIKRMIPAIGIAAAALLWVNNLDQPETSRITSPYVRPVARFKPAAPAVTTVVAQRPRVQRPVPTRVVVAEAAPLPFTVGGLPQTEATQTVAFVDTTKVQIVAPPAVPAPTLTFEQVRAAEVERADPSASSPGGSAPSAGHIGFRKPTHWWGWLWPIGHDE